MLEAVRAPVLVTGGAGYIGSHVALALLDAGWRVIVLDDLSTSSRDLIPEGAVFIRGDIGDRASLARLFARWGIGAVLHFAGSINVNESMTRPLKYYDNNTAKSRDLIEACLKAGVGHFVFSSTSAVYGSPQGAFKVAEDRPTAPISPYGRSKLMIEQMLADVAAAHPMNYCALRYFNVAGADPEGRSGQSTKDATHLVKVALEAAVGKRWGVEIFGADFDTPDGTGVRDYIHVSDLAAAHVRALERLIARPENFILNCGYGRGYSVLDVLDSVERVSERRIERRFVGRREGDSPALVADNALILATLPWKPERDDLDTMIADALAWERHGAGGAPRATLSYMASDRI